MKKIAMLGAVGALGLTAPLVSTASASAAEPGLQWREVTSSSSDQIDRLCWQTQHVWDAQAVADVPCTKAAQRDGKFYAYYLADTGKAA